MKMEIKENKILEEKVYSASLDWGPEVYVLPRKGYNKKYAIYSTHFGSIDNSFRAAGNGEGKVTLPDGVAHFLEHKLFDDEEGNVLIALLLMVLRRTLIPALPIPPTFFPAPTFFLKISGCCWILCKLPILLKRAWQRSRELSSRKFACMKIILNGVSFLIF